MAADGGYGGDGGVRGVRMAVGRSEGCVRPSRKIVWARGGVGGGGGEGAMRARDSGVAEIGGGHVRSVAVVEVEGSGGGDEGGGGGGGGGAGGYVGGEGEARSVGSEMPSSLVCTGGDGGGGRAAMAADDVGGGGGGTWEVGTVVGKSGSSVVPSR